MMQLLHRLLENQRVIIQRLDGNADLEDLGDRFIVSPISSPDELEDLEVTLASPEERKKMVSVCSWVEQKNVCMQSGYFSTLPYVSKILNI